MEVSKVFALGMILWTLAAQAEVVAEHLPEMKAGTIGVETGLTGAIWGDNPDADQVLNQIRVAGEVDLSDSEKEILKRILMTDVGGVAVLEERGEEYLTARVDTLMAQGMFDEALFLLSRISERHLSNKLKQLKSEVLFAAGRVTEACSENYMEAFGQEEAFIRAVCADAIGVPPASALAYEVYREGGYDIHPYLNAVGEVLYRDGESLMPAGEPSVWEVPMMARVWGMDIFKLPLSRVHLWELINQEQISQEVRLAAENLLKRKEKKQPDGQVLMHLIRMAESRAQVDAVIGSKNAK